MRVINVSLSELETKVLMIGFEGENEITQVRIDAAEILTDYPNATPTLIAKPLFGFAYPVIVAMEGTDVVWEIDNSVLSFHGDGEIQLTFTQGTVIAKSYVGRIRIRRSLAVNGEKPDPIETWEQAATAKLAEVDAQIGELEDMVEAAEAAKDQAQDIVDDAAADIQAAGAAQVQVVQAKGTEVLNSIPADYTELSDDVTDLKSAINSMSTAKAQDVGKALKAKTVSGGKVTEWEFGETGVAVDPTLSIEGKAADAKVTGESINNAFFNFASGDFVIGAHSNYTMVVSSTTRITNKAGYHITFGYDVTIEPSDDIKYFIYYSDETVSQWRTNAITLSKGTSISIVIAYRNDATVTDISDLLSKLKLINPLHDRLNGMNQTINNILQKTDKLLFFPNMLSYKTGYEYGYINNNGSISTSFGNQSIYYEQYIPIDEGKNYFLKTDFDTNAMGMSWYAADKSFLSRNNYYPPTDKKKISATAPATAKYLRVALLYKSDITDDFLAEHKIVVTDEQYSDIDASQFGDEADAVSDDDTDNPRAAFYGKRVSILGDSISTFAGSNPASAGDGHTVADGTYTYAGNHCRYPNSYLSNVNDTYWMRLINDFEMVLGVNDSWAGSKVSWNGTESSDAGANIYIASQTRIGHLGLNGTPDYIIVNAGTNDIYGSTLGTFNTDNPRNYTDEEIAALPVATFADAYRAMLIRLQKMYPLARIVVMLPDYTTDYYTPTKADQYLELIKEACDFFGVPWVDMRTVGITMYNTDTYLGDGIHPNVVGMELLYKKLAKFFMYSL